MPSKLSKKMDQKFLSKAELRKNRQVKELKRRVNWAGEIFLEDCRGEFGVLFVKRLQASARRAKKSSIGYAADVLCK